MHKFIDIFFILVVTVELSSFSINFILLVLLSLSLLIFVLLGLTVFYMWCTKKVHFFICKKMQVYFYFFWFETSIFRLTKIKA